jgi:ATP-dependent helicase HepA
MAARRDLTARLEQGRDRLLELNSFRAEPAVQLVNMIQDQDGDQSLDEFMISVFDHFSIHVEELAPRTYRLGSGGVFADPFPGLPAEGFAVTADRQRALSREEVQFLTWDHPLSPAHSICSWVRRKGTAASPTGLTTKRRIYLEAIYLLECIAPPQLHVDRFLPPTPLRVLVDHRGQDVGASISMDMLTVI